MPPEYPPEFDDEPLCELCGSPCDEGSLTLHGRRGAEDYCSEVCLALRSDARLKVVVIANERREMKPVVRVADEWATDDVYVLPELRLSIPRIELTAGKAIAAKTFLVIEEVSPDA